MKNNKILVKSISIAEFFFMYMDNYNVEIPYNAYLITYACIWFKFKEVVRWISSTFIFVNIFLHFKTIGIAVFGIHSLWQEHRTDIIFNTDAIFRLKIETAPKFPFLQTQMNKYQQVRSN